MSPEGAPRERIAQPEGPLMNAAASGASRAAKGLSIAPTEFPKWLSAAGAIGLESHPALPHRPLRWSVPIPRHAQRRFPVRA